MVRPSLSAKVLTALAGRRLATAESLTGGGIGAAITSVSGASAVFAGGVISYTNEVKNQVLGVPVEVLNTCGAVSAPVAKAMAEGARRVIGADVAVAVTGLAGPDADESAIPWARCSSAMRMNATPSPGSTISPATAQQCGSRPSKPRWRWFWN